MLKTILFVCIFACTSCGKSEKATQETTGKKPVASQNQQPTSHQQPTSQKKMSDEQLFIQRLSKAWSLTCAFSPPHNAYQIVTATFMAEQVTFKAMLFSDSGCRNEVSVITSQGKNSVGEPAKNHPSGYVIRTSFQTVQYAALSDAEVNANNRTHFCGILDWKKGEARDVSHGSCLDPSFGKTVVNVAQISGNQLTLFDSDAIDGQGQSVYWSDRN